MIKKAVIYTLVTLFIVSTIFWKIGGYVEKNSKGTQIITIREPSKAEIFAESKRGILKISNNNLFFDLEEEQEIVMADKKKSIAEYAQEISLALKIMEKERSNELDTFVKIINNQGKNSKKEILALEDSLLIFDNLIESLKEINPPEDALDIHREIIFYAEKVADNLYYMGRVIIYPQQALDSAWRYPRDLEYFYASLIALNNYFEEKNFIFAEKDIIKINAKL